MTVQKAAIPASSQERSAAATQCTETDIGGTGEREAGSEEQEDAPSEATRTMTVEENDECTRKGPNTTTQQSTPVEMSATERKGTKRKANEQVDEVHPQQQKDMRDLTQKHDNEHSADEERATSIAGTSTDTGMAPSDTFTANDMNTGRGHTKRKQTDRYGHAKVTEQAHKRAKPKEDTKKRKRENAVSPMEGKAASQKAGPRKLLIRVGHRLVERIEGTYEDHNAPT